MIVSDQVQMRTKVHGLSVRDSNQHYLGDAYAYVQTHYLTLTYMQKLVYNKRNNIYYLQNRQD